MEMKEASKRGREVLFSEENSYCNFLQFIKEPYEKEIGEFEH
jgi:hypothetical protein